MKILTDVKIQIHYKILIKISLQVIWYVSTRNQKAFLLDTDMQ